MNTEAQLVLEGNEASLEVYLDRLEIRPVAMPAAGGKVPQDREVIFYRDVCSIAVQEIGIFKSGFIEFGIGGEKRAVGFDYADMNMRAVGIRSFVLKQMQRLLGHSDFNR